MLKSDVIIVSIDRPFEEVYAFCSEPLNFGRWATNLGTTMEPLGPREYLVELSTGQMILRFQPHNAFGILDYQAYKPGETEGAVRPVRLVRNGSGTDIQVTWFQQEGMSDENFRSEVEWMRSDVLRLKALLEVGGPLRCEGREDADP